MKKIIYINIDGFSYSYYAKMQEEGYEFLGKLKKNAIFFENLRSGLISITNPMQSSILSGAYPDKTGNFYQHFDKKTKTIVKHKRTFNAQNISQLFVDKGYSTLSIHQFMLENNPNLEGDKNKAYIKSPITPSRYQDRFDILFDVIDKKPVKSGEKEIIYDELPQFTAFYLDDIDSLGHNNNYDNIPKRKTHEERLEDIKLVLKKIERNVYMLIQKLQSSGEFENTVILITTDHGMTPFFGKSSIFNFLEDINNLGVKANLCDAVDDETEIAVLPYTIESTLYEMKDIGQLNRKLLEEMLNTREYILGFKGKEEMMRGYGYPTYGGNYIVSASYGNHFYHKDFCEYYGASHDSFHHTSQHIFGMIVGGDIRGNIVEEKIKNISLIPSILKKYYNAKLEKSTNEIFKNWWSNL